MKSPVYFLMYFPADGLHFPVMISCKAYLKNKRPVLVRTARLGKPQSAFHPGPSLREGVPGERVKVREGRLGRKASGAKEAQRLRSEKPLEPRNGSTAT